MPFLKLSWQSLIRIVKDLSCYLFATSDRELFKGSDVINQEIHKSKLVTESNTDIQARWVKSNAKGFLSKFLVQLKVTTTHHVRLLQHTMLYRCS